MKFILGYFASLIIYATLISSAKVKNTQIFDVVQKSLSVHNTPTDNSIFGDIQSTNKNKQPAGANNSLFSPVNFNQISERNLEKNKSSLFDVNPALNTPNKLDVISSNNNAFNTAVPPKLATSDLENKINKNSESEVEQPTQKSSLFADPNKIINKKNNPQATSENKDSGAVSGKSGKTQTLNARKAAGSATGENGAKMDDFPKQIKKEIEESLKVETEDDKEPENSPIKKVSEKKEAKKSNNKDKKPKTDKEQSSKSKKALNKNKESPNKKSEKEKPKESKEKKANASEASATSNKHNNKKAKEKKTNKSTDEALNSTNKNKQNNENNKIDLDSEDAIEKEIEKLKQQVKNLIEMNNSLVKRLEKIDSKNPKIKIDKNIMTFVQKYDGKVKEIDSRLNDEQKAFSDDFNKKENNLKNLYETTHLNFNELKSQVKNLNKKLGKIEEKQNVKDESLKTGFEGDRLTVENNLNVKGITYSKRVSTKEVNLQNVEFNENLLKVGDNTKLVIGSESFDFSEVAKLLAYIDTIQAHCGENFELCKFVSNEKTNEIEQKQKNIVENMKRLRGETNKVLSKHGGRDTRKDRNYKR